MQRRRLLAALGAGVSLSGCVGSFGSDSRTTTRPSVTETASTSATTGTTATPSTTTATPDEATTEESTTTSRETPIRRAIGQSAAVGSNRTVTVHDVRVRKTMLTMGVHVDPFAEAGAQFVLADVSVSDREHLRDLVVGRAFGVVADGVFVDGDAHRAAVVFDRSAEPTGTLVGFSVPAPLSAGRAAFVWTGGTGGPVVRWALDEDHLDALAHPPEFEVRGFEVPDEVTRGAAFTATLTVANVGSGDGTFLAEVGATTISDTPEIRIEVPAGETVTAERRVDPYYPESGDEMEIVLNWSVDRLRRTVGVVD